MKTIKKWNESHLFVIFFDFPHLFHSLLEDGNKVTMDVPAQLVNGKTMVPLRFLSEELGYTVTWDEETRTAIIE